MYNRLKYYIDIGRLTFRHVRTCLTFNNRNIVNPRPIYANIIGEISSHTLQSEMYT